MVYVCMYPLCKQNASRRRILSEAFNHVFEEVKTDVA